VVYSGVLALLAAVVVVAASVRQLVLFKEWQIMPAASNKRVQWRLSLAW
jgi:hypothetical protein